MVKTKKDLTQLKTEYETLINELKELSEDELKMVTGGGHHLPPIPEHPPHSIKHNHSDPNDSEIIESLR